MARNKCNNFTPENKQLTAQEIYQLTSETLQAHFKLDMSNSRYEAQDIWDVLVAAAVERVTIEMACGLLEDAPSPNTVRAAVRDLLASEATLIELEDMINGLLVARLPRKLRKRGFTPLSGREKPPFPRISHRGWLPSSTTLPPR